MVMKCQICGKTNPLYWKKACSIKCWTERRRRLEIEYRQAKFEREILNVIKYNELSRETMGPRTKNLDLMADYLKVAKEKGIEELLRITK